MGLASNILTRVNCHTLRREAVQDVAHLPSASNGAGFVSNEIRQALGHGNAPFSHGITQAYVGCETREFYNNRAERQYINPWTPKFSVTSAMDIMKAPISNEEIRQWQSIHEPLNKHHDSHEARVRARDHVWRERHVAFVVW